MTRMSKVIRYALGFIVVLVVVAAIIPIEPKVRPPAKTKAAIELILYEADMRGVADGEGLRKLLNGATDSVAINRAIAAWAMADTNLASRVSVIRVSTDGLILDGWGRPLNFALRSAEVPRISPALLNQSETSGLIIWSSGPNGANEFGRGDDIFPTNLVFYRR